MRRTRPALAPGKARSRLNALNHGLLASEAANFGVEGEAARNAFESLTDRLEDYYRPRGPIEEILVQKIAIATWRLKRAMRFESRTMHEDSYRADIAYEEWSHRHKGRTHPYLLKLRDWGIDGVTLSDPPHTMLLMRYESAINRDLYRAMNEIRKLRKEQASSDEPTDHIDEATEASGVSDRQNYQTNPNPPPVNTGDGLEARIEGESPPDRASSP